VAREDLEELNIKAEGEWPSPLGVCSRTSAWLGLKEEGRMKAALQSPISK